MCDALFLLSKMNSVVVSVVANKPLALRAERLKWQPCEGLCLILRERGGDFEKPPEPLQNWQSTSKLKRKARFFVGSCVGKTAPFYFLSKLKYSFGLDL